MTNQEIKTTGQTIAQETQIGGNTAGRVGGVIEGIGVAFDNKDAANGYYQATISGGSISVNAPNYVLGTGGNLRLKMPAAGTTASTLTIGNANTVQLWYNGAAVSAQNTWDANEIISVFYDGTRFMASNSQGGEGKAEKIKYDNSQSGLAADNVQGAVDEISKNNVFKDAEAQMGGYAYGVVYANSSTWTWYDDGKAKHRVITLQGGEKYIKITASAAHGAGIGFLKTYTAPTQSQRSIDWCSGYSHGQGPSAGETAIYPIPSDCNYIVVDTTINNLDYSPAYIGLGISNQEVYDEASDADLKVLINDGNFTRAIGAVDGSSGAILTGATNNFYVDITIPSGSKVVEFPVYITGNVYGCAFMNGSTYVSGYYNRTLSTGTKVLVDVPENATIFRYSYYTNRYATQNNLPIFDNIVFHKYGSREYILKELSKKEGKANVNTTISDIERNVGSVDYTNGQTDSSITYNFWSDIEIPIGSKTVNFRVFQTGGNWGCAFMNGNTFVQGFRNTRTQLDSGKRVTLQIPQDATVFRYSYITDSVALQNNIPIFDNIVFGKEMGIAELAEEVEEIKEGGVTKYMNRPSTGCHAFSVKVNISIPKLDETDSAAIQDSYTEGTDYGFIMFPTNYTADGEPTRLIITCHGAGASLSDYQSNAWKNFSQTYWCNLGYAIMDMYACPPELSGSTSEMHYGNPTVLECYKKGFDYVMEKFNLRRDGIFVVGSSMGGLSSFQIVDSGMFQVLAQIGNCPCIDIFKQAYCNPWTTVTYQREKIATYFGFEGTAPTWTTSKPPSAAETQYFISNFGKTIGYYPILKNVVSGDISSIFDVIPSSVNAVTDAEEAVLYDALTSIHPCPIKIFHCKDDTTMAYRYSKYFIDMVRRSGQLAYFRPFATGGHSAWDAGNTTTVTDIDGNSLTLSASKYEAYLFFKRFDK